MYIVAEWVQIGTGKAHNCYKNINQMKEAQRYKLSAYANLM